MADRTKRTGTVSVIKNAAGEVMRHPSGLPRYSARISLKDGTRRRVEVPERYCKAEKWAIEFVEEAQKDEDATAWYERFAQHRRNEVGSSDDDEWRWKKWVSPRIGAKPIAKVTSDDIEDVRDALSAAVLAYESAGNAKGEGRLSPKTAQNVWSALTTAMKYASTLKGPRDLRVRLQKGNPCAGVGPPRTRASKKRLADSVIVVSRRLLPPGPARHARQRTSSRERRSKVSKAGRGRSTPTVPGRPAIARTCSRGVARKPATARAPVETGLACVGGRGGGIGNA